MTISSSPLLSRMHTLTKTWKSSGVGRFFFLSCYQMMTVNMLAGVEQQEFADSDWVRTFVAHFADYYYIALDAYELDPASAPAVWRVAHDATRDGQTWPLQQLLLGVNAHINYDLVLTVDELLRPSWQKLAPDHQATRRADYDRVNDIIARTVDAVQDEVLDPAMPVMDWIDRLLGRADERLLSALLTAWRNDVWDHAVRLIEAADPAERTAIVRGVETAALRRAEAIRLADWTALDELV